MADIEDILTNAWKSAKKSRDWHLGEARTCQDQLDKIAQAGEAIGLELEDDQAAEVVKFSEVAPIAALVALPDMTMKEASIEVLKRSKHPMTTNQVLSELNQMLGTSYPRSSLSPQLSRLKADKRIHRVDGLWAYSQVESTETAIENGEGSPAKESEPSLIDEEV